MPEFTPLTYEELHQAIEARDLYGSVKQAASVLGWTEQKLQHRINMAREEGMCEAAQPRKYKAAGSDFGVRRHLFIPDTQVRPGVPLDNIDWVAQAIVDYKPDVVVMGGDHWDFPSLNGHVEPGSVELEGRRYQDDLDAGNAAYARLCAPLEAELDRRGNRWNPRLEYLQGNHEDRADRVAAADPKWMGHVGSNACQVRRFKWNRFLERVWIDGVCYSHFFQNSHSKHAIGGTVDNRLNKIGCSFVQGHEQGFRYGTRITGSGHTWHGVVAGSCYLHTEGYRGAQGQRHFRGLIVMNEVENGDFGIMPVSLDYLCRKYEGMRLRQFMDVKYRDEDWSHLG